MTVSSRLKALGPCAVFLSLASVLCSDGWGNPKAVSKTNANSGKGDDAPVAAQSGVSTVSPALSVSGNQSVLAVSQSAQLTSEELRRINEGVATSRIAQEKAKKDGSSKGIVNLGINVPSIGIGRDATHDTPVKILKKNVLTEFRPIIKYKIPGPVDPGGGSPGGNPGGRSPGVTDPPARQPAAEAGSAAGLRMQPSRGLPQSRPVAILGGEPAETAGRSLASAPSSGQLKLRMGDYPGALEDAAEAIRAASASPDGYLLRAMVLSRTGDFQEAVKASVAAVRTGGGREAYEQAAWAELHLERYNDAVANATRAIQLDPKSADAFVMRAFAYEKLGKRDAMIEDLREAARLDPAKYGELLKRALAGQTLFDPKDKDNWSLLEGLGGRGRSLGRGPLLGLALLGLSLLGLLVAFRKRLGELLSPWRAAAADGKAPGAAAGALGGKYVLGQPLPKGTGGGVGWEARDLTLDRPVILKKVVFSDEQERRRRLESARRLGELRHPNIVDIYEILDLPDGLFLVFERVEGRTVQSLLAQKGPLPLATAAKLLKPVAGALEAAHARGVIHANLKLSNVALSDNGYVKVMDFGLRGEGAGPAVDVAALAACLYEMVTGTAAPGKGLWPPAAGRFPGVGPDFDDFLSKAHDSDADPRSGIRSMADFSAGLGRLSP